MKWTFAVSCGFGFAACGSRTGLLSASEPTEDASVDAGPDVHADAKHDAFDAHDAVGEDALPSIDASVPDVVKPSNCTDAASTLVYMFSDAAELLSFDPASLVVTTIGTVACPTTGTPNSMAVDHLGVAYANFLDVTKGEIWKLSTANATCTPTAYTTQFGFARFGMGFVGDNDGGENLYIANILTTGDQLARVDLPSMKLELEGTLNPPVSQCELTGRSDGQLFGYCINKTSGATLAQIDPPTATVVAADQLKTGAPTNAWAFAFWGGKFWIFTGTQGQGSNITEYDPATHSEAVVEHIAQTIVGAGVSTCAPVE